MPDQEEDLRQQIADTRKQYEQLQRDNKKELIALAQYGVTVDGDFINRIRIDSLVSFIFSRMGNTSQDVRELLTWLFECEFERNFNEKMSEIKAEVRKAQVRKDLAAGGAVPENMLAKMWEAQQSFERGRGNGKG